jgi:hypothetical protein
MKRGQFTNSRNIIRGNSYTNSNTNVNTPRDRNKPGLKKPLHQRVASDKVPGTLNRVSSLPTSQFAGSRNLGHRLSLDGTTGLAAYSAAIVAGTKPTLT